MQKLSCLFQIRKFKVKQYTGVNSWLVKLQNLCRLPDSYSSISPGRIISLCSCWLWSSITNGQSTSTSWSTLMIALTTCVPTVSTCILNIDPLVYFRIPYIEVISSLSPNQPSRIGRRSSDKRPFSFGVRCEMEGGAAWWFMHGPIGPSSLSRRNFSSSYLHRNVEGGGIF